MVSYQHMGGNPSAQWLSVVECGVGHMVRNEVPVHGVSVDKIGPKTGKQMNAVLVT